MSNYPPPPPPGEPNPYGQPNRNRGTVKAGYICGIIGTALSAIGILLNVILLAVGASLY